MLVNGGKACDSSFVAGRALSMMEEFINSKLSLSVPSPFSVIRTGDD